MSSLWTPGGEHRIPSQQAVPPEHASSPAGDRGEQVPGAEARAELAELERQLLAAAPEDVIANHCYGIFQLAALYLAQRPPRLDSARLAIDALGCLVNGLGERLGAAAPTLAESVTQIQLAFVELARAHERADGGQGGGQ
ncbi:MAG TPA: hypothetical protein VKV23_08575 [Acidimicrobiales bacterium]|jgi:hypothetical protein|nr:hypothetical protein [Acidimicrobiales bacterium]